MVKKESHQTINYDERLSLPLDFVCKCIDVSKEDFVTLALSNLLIEEFDHLKNCRGPSDIGDVEELVNIIKAVKFEANGWVINRKK
jgi:hypothetical protein